MCACTMRVRVRTEVENGRGVVEAKESSANSTMVVDMIREIVQGKPHSSSHKDRSVMIHIRGLGIPNSS